MLAIDEMIANTCPNYYRLFIRELKIEEDNETVRILAAIAGNVTLPTPKVDAL